jgi:23S rRNA (uracil1939-C5)-methyltransferase
MFIGNHMTVKKGQIYHLDIRKAAFGGKGLGHLGGLAVFVGQTIPGDVARVKIIKKKKNFAVGQLLDLETASPDRVSAPCPYSGYCGGCKWQFVRYSRQLEFKRGHVVESLEHIGQINYGPIHPTLPSPRMYKYRNKMEFSCADRPWRLPHEMVQADIETGFAIGLHVPGTFYKVLDIERCLLQPDLGNTILGDVRKYIRRSEQPVYGLRSHQGFWRFLMLRHSFAYDKWLVNIITAENRGAVNEPLAEMLITRYPNVAAVVNNITARKAGIAVGEYEVPLRGDSWLKDRIGSYDFWISANSFFQTNTPGAETLYEVVKKYADLSGSEDVIDLYCGAGTIAIYLADACRQVIGMEINAGAVKDAIHNCEINSVANCRFIQGDIGRYLDQVQTTPDVMIIDPPRTGMHKKVVGQVLALGPPRIVYVSCNPATLARDLGLMSQRYRVCEVQPVDMFPHTFHVEAVAKLEKNP